MISKRGILDIDLIIAFLLVLLIFVSGATIASVITTNTGNSIGTSSEVASKIARSYGLLSELSDGRDNEITLLRLQALQPQNVSLRGMSGYYYGGSQNSLCIKRAVYIKDVKDVGILEVC